MGNVQCKLIHVLRRCKLTISTLSTFTVYPDGSRHDTVCPISQSQDLANHQFAHSTSMSTIRTLLTHSREWELQKYGK
jgi:hypothetical protein